MGTTARSIHIYSDAEPNVKAFSFQSFSDGWYTCVDKLDEVDCFKAARRISRETPGPVMYFAVWDSDQILLMFFRSGKNEATFSTDAFMNSKGTSRIPELTGNDVPGRKKRIGDILKCSDADRMISLLEEYFGVSLLAYDDPKDDPSALRREKGDALYLGYKKELDAMRGKRAPIRIVLEKEFPGQLFKFTDYYYGTRGVHRRITDTEYLAPHYFCFGFESPGSNSVIFTEFTGGELVPRESGKNDENRIPHPGIKGCYNPENEYLFDSEAPEEFRNKRIRVPWGLYPLDFDGRGHVLFVDYKRTLFALDPDGMIVARIPIKGGAIDFRDGYILTESSIEPEPYYVPWDIVRIYRLVYGADGK
ncbi:MAG: hypothetical protein IJU75_02635 [Clostridia bacterium]|nr:hypothetical protein [Clostridia bacterium]